MLKHLICLLTRRHQWAILVIPHNDWGDTRQQGFICKYCGKIKDLREKEDINAYLQELRRQNEIS